MNLSSPLTVLYNRETQKSGEFKFIQNRSKNRFFASLYYKEQSTANSNSFKIAQKTAFEAKGRLYTTGKVIQRLFIFGLYTQLANGKSSTFTIK